MPMTRESVQSGTDWENKVGYSRAIKVKDTVYVSGTTATDEDGSIVGVGDPYEQTARCIDNISRALEEFGVGLKTVVWTRMYVVDIDQWEEIGRAHEEAFNRIRPATSMVEVSRLIDPDLLVEMEAEARIQQ